MYFLAGCSGHIVYETCSNAVCSLSVTYCLLNARGAPPQVLPTPPPPPPLFLHPLATGACAVANMHYMQSICSNALMREDKGNFSRMIRTNLCWKLPHGAKARFGTSQCRKQFVKGHNIHETC